MIHRNEIGGLESQNDLLSLRLSASTSNEITEEEGFSDIGTVAGTMETVLIGRLAVMERAEGG